MIKFGLFQNLNSQPRLNEINQWADYIELLALTSEDQLFSQGQLQALEVEIDDIAVDMDNIDYDNEIPADDQYFESLQGQEKLNRRWADIKTCLNSRKLRFQDAWPFELKGDVLYADKINPENGLHRLYIALLLASALRYIEKKRQNEITSSLEEIGYHVFRSLMPTNQTSGEPAWIIKPFGAHQKFSEGYQGTLFEKIKKLADDLHTKILIEEDDFKPGNSGDGGLDLVAWHPMGDELGCFPIAFARCGCSLGDLPNKHFEAHAANWSNKIHIQHPHANYYFAPHDLRQNSGRWDKQIGQVIMLDRTRILYLAKLYQLSAENFKWSHIDEAINTRRNLTT